MLIEARSGAQPNTFYHIGYIDSLLERLKLYGIGCYVCRTYAGAFGYADDVALLAPSLISLKHMMKICEDYAEDYHILFNPTIYKLVCYNL